MKKVFIFLFFMLGLFSAHADVTYPFSLTTTSLSANSTFQFKMSATGTFYVNCGDGGTLTSNADPTDISNGNTITRSDTTETIYTCAYSTGGAKIIQFGGTATGYNTGVNGAAISFYNLGASKIASISGSLSIMFPQLGSVSGQSPMFRTIFYGATNLTSIPETLFSGYTIGSQNMFRDAFRDCTSLTSIPENLFASFTTGANGMFYSTFYGCTGLISIPSELFAGFTRGRSDMFAFAFFNCIGLTFVPENLFKNITTDANYMFTNTILQLYRFNRIYTTINV